MIGVGVGLPFARSSGAGAAGGGGALKPQDVFKTWTWTGGGTSQVLSGAPNLSGKDWLFHAKSRTAAYGHTISDTKRGLTNQLVTNTGMYQQDYGFSLSGGANSITIGTQDLWINGGGFNYTGFIAVDAPKFLRIVTWTGNGVNGRTIAHNLGVVPGMVWVKVASSISHDWHVWHKSATGNLYLNYPDQQDTGDNRLITAVDDTSFTFGSTYPINAVNGNTYTYVAYVWADDPDGVIDCGSFTTDAGGSSTVNIGWKPQWALIKRLNVSDSWYMFDTLRGWGAGNDKALYLNTSDLEGAASDWGAPNASGFTFSGGGPSSPYAYMAIREPY